MAGLYACRWVPLADYQKYITVSIAAVYMQASYSMHLTIPLDVHMIKHGGTLDTLSTIRARFWILKGRQAVKYVLKFCMIATDSYEIYQIHL